MFPVFPEEVSRGLQGGYFLNFQGGGGGSMPIFCRFNGQNERILRAGGGHGPSLPMPAYAYGSETAQLE